MRHDNPSSGLKTRLGHSWNYVKTRDLSFWSVIATFLLVVITLFLVVATKKMADVMLMDYTMRTTPVFRLTTPSLTTNEVDTIISFSVANASQGIAKRTIHNVFIEDASGNLFPVQNVIVGEGKWAKKLNQIPIDYVPRVQQNIKLNWPKRQVLAAGLRSVVIVLSYDTLFDKKRRFYTEGFVYEYDHNNFDPMTEDRLSKLLEAVQAKNLLTNAGE
jgi:hypothetical protein